MLVDILPVVWAVIISLIIITYVILDGFDLGVGINFIFLPHERHRDIMMNSVAPFWDGNETWMVLGAACLYGAFPTAFASLLPFLYEPISLMVFCLIFRGAAFEFRFKDQAHKRFWSFCFCFSSVAIAFLQGYILGQFLMGVRPRGAELELLPVISGLGVVAGYSLLGLTWLIQKTSGALQTYVYEYARYNLYVLAGFFVIISLVSPVSSEHIMARWFAYPAVFYLMLLPLFSATMFYKFWRCLRQRQDEQRPFFYTVILFGLGYAGQFYSIFPYIVPYKYTFWQAAGPTESLVFLLIGTAILLPVLIGYTLYSYKVFRGKSSEQHYY